MKKLDDKTYRLRKLGDFIGVLALALLLLFLWQLYRGPIAMPFLKPYIIKALNHDDTDYTVTVESVNLELVRSIKPLRIIANNVVYRKNNDEIVINAPKTSVSFSIKALLRGVIAPSSIEVIKPTVYLFTTYGIDENKKDEINQKKLEYYFDGMQDFVERFNSDDKSYPESYINDIDIINAEVEFHEVDLGHKWVLSDVNYRFDRNLTNLETEINALLKFNDVPASVGVEAVYRPLVNKVALQFYFADIIPANLVDLLTSGKQNRELYKINIPLNGKVEALVNIEEVIKNKADLIASLDSAIEKLNFEMEGGQGEIAFSDDATYNYPVSSLLVKGELTGGLDKIKISDAVLNIGGQKAVWGVEASGMKDYLLKSSLRRLKVKLAVMLPQLQVNDLYKYWPRYIAPEAWKWCRESLFDGDFTNASFTFDFGYDKALKKFGFQKLQGTAGVADSSIDYLTGMPRITNIYGTAEFSNDKIIIRLDKGVSDDVVLNNGYVELYDLNKYDNFAKISLSAVGSVSDVLKLIDHDPLNYTSDMGLSPNQIKGTAETTLDLAFELKKNLAPDEVKVKVQSVISDVTIPNAVAGKAIEAKKLDLEVTNKGLLVTGVTSFEGIPISLLWNENFADKNYQSRYQLNFNFDSNLKSKMGIDFKALNAPYIMGSLPTEAVVTVYDKGKMVIDVKGDLRTAEIDYSFLGFKKNAGTDGTISARLDIKNNLIVSIPKFSLSKPGFNLNGKVSFDAQGAVKTVDISKISGPNTSARAVLDFSDIKSDKIKITVSGESYNLSDLFAKDETKNLQAKQKRRLRMQNAHYVDTSEEDELEKVSNTDINIAVNSLWTNENVAIRNFAGSAKLRRGIGVEEMHLVGSFVSSRRKEAPARLKLDYVPRSNKEYLLNIESSDAGSTLKFLRLYDDMRGGTLNINARRTPDKKFVGHAKIRDFNLYNTPVLARLLTVASFSGLLNILSGEGIAFSHFDAPFEYQYKTLRITDAKTFGDVMGISASGTYSTRFQEFNIRGLIAPAYGLNTFIGSIPLVGSLLSGKDGTVFAANYSITGSLDDPKISINPLSALSPNSLKELFSNLFGSRNER